MVTQAEIAHRLGVSRQLVSFALAGYPQVSKESRDRILKAATEMGYRPNPHARALKQKRTGIIALWIPDQISTHYTHVARELAWTAKRAGYELIVSEAGSGRTTPVWAHIPVDGICAVDAPRTIQKQLESMAATGIPVVSVGAYGSSKTDRVKIDLSSGTRELMNHLIDTGSRKILHATFVAKDSPTEERRGIYARAMQDAGLIPEYLIYPLGDRIRPITRQLIKDHISQHGKPDAIFCHSDDAAIGIYRGLLDLGLSIPEDVALAGCDGIEDTEYLERPLTTLVQPLSEMCASAWELLENRIGNEQLAPITIRLKAALSIRDSTPKGK